MSHAHSLALQLALFCDTPVAFARPRRGRLGRRLEAIGLSSVLQLALIFEARTPERRRLPIVLDPVRLSSEQRIELMKGRLEYARELDALDACRPKTRADCADVPRPCPFVSCRWNTYLDVDERGRITIGRPEVLPEERAESCALDVIEQNPDGLEPADVAAVLGLSREVLGRIEEHGRLAIARDAELADAHDRAPAAANDAAPTATKRERPSPASGDVKRRLSMALRERAVLDLLAEGPKTVSELVVALASTATPIGEWWVRHVCRLLRGRELLSSTMVSVDGRAVPVLRWQTTAAAPRSSAHESPSRATR